MLDIRQEFPILSQTINKKYPLVYLDNAATTQKPLTVLNAINNYYTTINSNVHRGVHTLSNKATDAFEAGRELIRSFINANSTKEIILTRGTTESINLAANSFINTFLQQNDEIITTDIEHHSNFVPWQQYAKKKKINFKVVKANNDGVVDLELIKNTISPQTKLIAITHVSNALGTIQPIKEITKFCHANNIKVLIDGAQAIPHLKIDVIDTDVDFYCFSGHKMYAPTGIGVLYGKKELLERMSPYQYGGEMISEVGINDTSFNELPYKFEAGTPNISGVVGLMAAIKFIQKISIEKIHEHESALLKYAMKNLQNEFDNINYYGNITEKAAVISFNVKNQHPYDIGTFLDKQGIAVRTGHHCTQPLMTKLKIPAGTVRASFAIYNTFSDIDLFVNALKKTIQLL